VLGAGEGEREGEAGLRVDFGVGVGGARDAVVRRCDVSSEDDDVLPESSSSSEEEEDAPNSGPGCVCRVCVSGEEDTDSSDEEEEEEEERTRRLRFRARFLGEVAGGIFGLSSLFGRSLKGSNTPSQPKATCTSWRPTSFSRSHVSYSSRPTLPYQL
jgi:hypothetical protein